MFLLQAVFLIFIVYWFSALIADIILTSDEERLLAPPLRIGFGFLLSLIYFSSSWLIMSIQQAWILGIILLTCYAFSNKNSIFRKNKLLAMKNLFFTYAKTFFMFLLAATVFFAPLILSNNYGPFTEGGGDISIYADTTKYLHDRQLTGSGYPSANLTDVKNNIKKALIPESYKKRMRSSDLILANPPSAEYANYRVTLLQSMNPLIFASTGAYSFISKETNYAIYYGLQAFLYACLLSGIWCFFQSFGIRWAIAGALLIAGSHGVISVFYNMYAMQALSLVISALIIATLPTIRVFSWPGLRTYGSALLPIWLCYIHFSAVILPLIFATAIFYHDYPNVKKSAEPKTLFFKCTAFICLFIWGFLAITGVGPSFSFVIAMFTYHAKDLSDYLNFGNPISIFTLQWFSFIFGFLSQQHFQPFAIESPILNFILTLGIISGLILLMVGGLVMRKVYASAVRLDRKKFYLISYIVAILTVLIHFYLARSSLYTQAKGAQNVLIYFYVILLLPFAIGALAMKQGLKVKGYLQILGVAFIIFMTILFTIRVEYLTKLAFAKDRGAILETSYFSEAEKIKQKDGDAFVLFEPRKSADLYLSLQPFFGKRIMPTRHLVTQTERFDAHNKQWIYRIVLASDLIKPEDWSHLWILNSECKKTWQWPHPACTWKAEQLIHYSSPQLLLFADDYEKNFTEKVINDSSNTKVVFSYLRNGAAMLFIPQAGGEVEVTMEPREPLDYKNMLAEISSRIKKEELKEVKLTSNGKYITLLYKITNTDLATLKLIAHFSGEYWLNVKFNHKDIT